VLFFGCRKQSEDYIYQEELEGYKKEGVLSGLHVAFSREQEHKVYVQHLLGEEGKTVFELLEKQGFFYVCGWVQNDGLAFLSLWLFLSSEIDGRQKGLCFYCFGLF